MKSVIYNESCLDTMAKMNSNSIDLIMTSPPYNMTKRKGGISDTGRYDVYCDWKTEDEYINFTIDVFNGFDKVLKENGVVLYNFSYSIENPSLPYKLITSIENRTSFMLIDTIIWKKSQGLPFPANKRRLSRNWEYVFVLCRKTEIETFDIFKGISSISEKTGQTYYNVYYNFVEARNNDGKNPYNQATYSSELVEKLLDIYGNEGYVVYDPFAGIGTTGIACRNKSMDFIGSEISENQIKYFEECLKST